MSNCIFGWPLYSDVGVTYSPVLSGGSWSTSLPLANLQDRHLAKVARSTDDALTSTIIKADLGVARSVRLVALVKHNLSSAATWRVRGMGAEPAYEGTDTWSDATGTPGKTTGQSDPLGGTRAVLLEDNDGAVIEQVKQTITGVVGDAEKQIALCLKADTAAQTVVHWRDATAGTNRHVVRVTWTAGVPSLSTESGTGDLYDPVALGGGWYQVQFSTDGVVAANVNEIHVRPAGSTAAATGTVYIYEPLVFNLTTQPVLHDTGVDAVWPSGIDAEEYDGYTKTAHDILSADVAARYWRIEMADTANPDGYVQAGRLAICGGWETTVNFAPGQKLQWDTSTSEEETDGGAIIVRDRAARRIASGTFENLPKNEALANPFDMQARLRRYGQLYAVLDPDDATNLHRQSFLARFKELSPIEAAFAAAYRTVPFALVEEL